MFGVEAGLARIVEETLRRVLQEHFAGVLSLAAGAVASEPLLTVPQLVKQRVANEKRLRSLANEGRVPNYGSAKCIKLKRSEVDAVLRCEAEAKVVTAPSQDAEEISSNIFRNKKRK